jgi:hypothetical protein
MALRRWTLVGALLVAVSGAMFVDAGASARAVTTDLVLAERSCDQDGSFCVSQGLKMGDEHTLNLLLTTRPGGERAGREYGECVVLNRNAAALYCDFVVELVDGSVAVQGRISFTHETNVLPVTGGTGAYEDAGGSWSRTGRRVDLHIVTP